MEIVAKVEKEYQVVLPQREAYTVTVLCELVTGQATQVTAPDDLVDGRPIRASDGRS